MKDSLYIIHLMRVQLDIFQKMIQDGGTPGEKKSKSQDQQKKISALENELELRFVCNSVICEMSM